MSAGKRVSSWRRRLVGLVVVLGAGLTLAYLLGYFEESYDFKAESRDVLVKVTGGSESATKAYEDASFPFRESRLLASFVDRADRLTETLGTFEDIESVEEIVESDTIRGRAVSVEYELRFSKVTTTGEISYLRESDSTWRLLGYKIRVPAMLASKVEQIDSEWDRIRAPREVVDMVDQILKDIAIGKGQEVRAQASPPFRKSTSEAGFALMLENIRAALGDFQRRLTILKTGQNGSKTRAKVSAILQYEKGKTTGTFEFIRVGKTWRLLHFQVVIPDPVLPVRRQVEL